MERTYPPLAGPRTMPSSMSLKTKILSLAVLPLLVVASLIMVTTVNQARQLGKEEILTFERNLLAAKRTELKHYVSLALTSIEPVYRHADPDDPEARELMKAILHSLTYGEDGYFFVYDLDGVNLVHPKQPELVGRNLYDLQDINGNHVIRNLLEVANKGGGYHRYMWLKPSLGEIVDKLSYAVILPEWGWMLGTGIYIDDIVNEIHKIEAQVNQNIRNTFFTVLVIIAVATALIVMVGVLINLHEHRLADSKLKELSQQTVLFQEDEKRRISRELHDGINQLMVSVKYRIELGMEKLRLNDCSASEDLYQGAQVLNEAINEVRRISRDLRPSILDDLGLLAALDSLLGEFVERTGIDLERDTPPCRQRLPEQIETTLYRIVQEALTNIERHSEATHVHLSTGWKGNVFQLTIRDDGKGFHIKEVLCRRGIGLRNMRERVEFLGGDFIAHSEPGLGTELKALFPMHSPA